MFLMARIKYQEAVGLEVKRGKPAKGKKPEKKELHRLYVNFRVGPHPSLSGID